MSTRPAAAGPINLFVLSTGFQYYFSTLLIDHLQLDNVCYAMYQPREGIEKRAAATHPVVFVDASDAVTRRFGKKAGKWRFAPRVRRELGLSGRDVRMFSPYYNETFIYALRRQLERHCSSIEYNLIAGGVELLRQLPGPPKFKRVPSWLRRLLLGVETADTTHKSGSYSRFLSRIYHFPAAVIHADPSKLEIVPLPESRAANNGGVLVLGGLSGITRGFVLAARDKAEGRPTFYRMHPKVRSGEKYITQACPSWTELKIDCVLEEHLLADPYALVLGGYSSAVVFNHLFVAGSRSEIVADSAHEDPEYHATATACGIPVTLVEG